VGMLILNLPRMYLDAVIYTLKFEQEGSKGFPFAVDFAICAVEAHVDIIVLQDLLVGFLWHPVWLDHRSPNQIQCRGWQ